MAAELFFEEPTCSIADTLFILSSITSFHAAPPAHGERKKRAQLSRPPLGRLVEQRSRQRESGERMAALVEAPGEGIGDLRRQPQRRPLALGRCCSSLCDLVMLGMARGAERIGCRRCVRCDGVAGEVGSGGGFPGPVLHHCSSGGCVCRAVH
ncbi:hypothetical protein BHM03_00058928 [Ensete ventricosum]|nr:hypothetical protein BHM03_00058928 [Ensete ventricosum]